MRLSKLFIVTVVLFSLFLTACGSSGGSGGGSSGALPPPEDPEDPNPDVANTITNAVGMKFVLIPAGSFMMGSTNADPAADDYEKPQHQVTISKAFYLGKYEVTQAQWFAVMGSNPSVSSTGSGKPVDGINWTQAQEFVQKLNEVEGTTKYRLPTEAEWEYAARAGSATAYSFGDDASQLGNYGWYRGNSGSTLHPVGSLLPNVWGLYDVHGNVEEIVYDAPYDYTADPQTDPVGTVPTADNRMNRGGHWYSLADSCRSANRASHRCGFSAPYLGVRIALEE